MKKYTILFFLITIISACKKPEPSQNNDTTSTTTEILSGFSSNVAQATYNDLAIQTSQLYDYILVFESSLTDQDLINCKQAWKDSRLAWEQSEGFLFGPVSSDNIDPRIDTWPVDFTKLDSVLNSNAVYSSEYIDSLQDALKGFHPIEYLLFGQNGNKTASEFTSPEIDYLKALALNLKELASKLSDSWNQNTTDNYYTEFINAGNGSTIYTTQRLAFEELVNAMAAICDEVANGKMAEPFTLQDPSLEESPFAFNSITDFTNNIQSVENVYLGTYAIDGKGLEDLVRQNNLSLDNAVKTKLNAALAALNNITIPFGQAITQQPTQVQNAMDAINDLKTEIEDELFPFVQQYTN